MLDPFSAEYIETLASKTYLESAEEYADSWDDFNPGCNGGPMFDTIVEIENEMNMLPF